MTLYPTSKCTPSRAVDILEMVGLDRIMANSAGDWGKSDPLAVPELIFEMRLWSGNYPHNCDSGAEFYGTKGQLFVSKRGKVELLDGGNKRVELKPPADLPPAVSHQADFVAAIRGGTRPAADIEEAYRTVALVHLGVGAGQGVVLRALGRVRHPDVVRRVTRGRPGRHADEVVGGEVEDRRAVERLENLLVRLRRDPVEAADLVVRAPGALGDLQTVLVDDRLVDARLVRGGHTRTSSVVAMPSATTAPYSSGRR